MEMEEQIERIFGKGILVGGEEELSSKLPVYIYFSDNSEFFI